MFLSLEKHVIPIRIHSFVKCILQINQIVPVEKNITF